MNLFKRKPTEINPGNINELDQLARKWHVPITDLSHAIVETGSLNIKVLRSHIKRAKSKGKTLNLHWPFSLHPMAFNKELS